MCEKIVQSNQSMVLLTKYLFWCIYIFQLAARDLRKGRDYLMWGLLQFISGSIQRNPVSYIKLLDNIYYKL